MRKPFKIYDWAGNRMTLESFETFEDAWSFIYCELTDRLGLTEEDYQEYYVEAKSDRASRYLDPKDVRNNRKMSF